MGKSIAGFVPNAVKFTAPALTCANTIALLQAFIGASVVIALLLSPTHTVDVLVSSGIETA
jgi:uncharacterized membrane protein YeaQ/YmgE (transglycosylase-associated protein family)